MKKLAATLIVIIPHLLIAQQFNAAAIPDSLTREADAVTRFEEIVFEIKSPGKAVFHERQVYTILNEDGEYLEKFVSPYNKFISIESISLLKGLNNVIITPSIQNQMYFRACKCFLITLNCK